MCNIHKQKVGRQSCKMTSSSPAFLDPVKYRLLEFSLKHTVLCEKFYRCVSGVICAG